MGAGVAGDPALYVVTFVKASFFSNVWYKWKKKENKKKKREGVC
jgi:hypothetical protein